MTDRAALEDLRLLEIASRLHNRGEVSDALRVKAAHTLLAEQHRVSVDPERLAQMIAHRACCGVEADNANGKIHGYCLVCGVPWPCEYVGTLPAPPTGGKL